MHCHGLRSPVDVTYLRSRGGSEILVRPVPARVVDEIARPGPEIASAISALVQEGGARIRVVFDPPSLCATVLPRIPELVLTEHTRSIHLTDDTSELPAEAASLRLSTDSEARGAQIARIGALQFDALTAELTLAPAEERERIARLAPVSFLAFPDADAAGTDPFTWVLDVAGTGEDGLDWRLRRSEP